MASLKKEKFYEYWLEVKHKGAHAFEDEFINHLKYVLYWYRKEVKNIKIKEIFLAMSTDDESTQAQIYIKFDESQLGAAHNYFKVPGSKGNQAFDKNHWVVEKCHVKEC